MYSKIVNPITGRKVDVTGTLGKQIVRKYLNVLMGGAAVATLPASSLSTHQRSYLGKDGRDEQEEERHRALSDLIRQAENFADGGSTDLDDGVALATKQLAALRATRLAIHNELKALEETRVEIQEGLAAIQEDLARERTYRLGAADGGGDKQLDDLEATRVALQKELDALEATRVALQKELAREHAYRRRLGAADGSGSGEIITATEEPPTFDELQTRFNLLMQEGEAAPDDMPEMVPLDRGYDDVLP